MIRLPRAEYFRNFLTKHNLRIVGWIVAPILLWAASTCGRPFVLPQSYGAKTQNLSSLFAKRMQKHGISTLPPIIFSEKVRSNAVWKLDTIRLGRSLFDQDFITTEDRISILYHEYTHYLNEKRELYPCEHDLAGHIIQIDTDIFYPRSLSEVEIEMDYKTLLTPEMSKEEKKLLWETVASPSLMRFRYAPSNLSRDELHCYRAEIKAEAAGMFSHSHIYRKMLESRINREESYLKMRTQFEHENGLLPTGRSF